MRTVPQGSWNQVVRSPATDATPPVRNTPPRPSNSARVASMSSQTSPTWVSPTRVMDGRPAGPSATSARGYSMSSSTWSSAPSPTMAALTTTGLPTSSPRSSSMAPPDISYGGDNTRSPRASAYQRVATSTSGTQTAA